MKKKTKTYKRTRFAVTTLLEAFGRLGSERSLSIASITLLDETVAYDSEERAFAAYASAPTTSLLTVVRSGAVLLEVRANATDVTIGVEAHDDYIVDRVFAPFDEAAEEARLPKPPSPLQVERFCVVAPLHWETLPHLAARLATHGISIESHAIELSRYPDNTTYSEWAPALEDIRKSGEPKSYSIWCHGTGPAGTFRLSISKARFSRTNEFFSCVTLSGLTDAGVADDIVAFLGLEPDRPSSSTSLPRSAFVAHRFDTEGERMAGVLARFLELLGFDVKTGRGFSPEPVGEKLRKRIESQAVLFILLTRGEDTTWLTQESLLAHVREKRVVILREAGVEYKAGMLGDLEYITFEGTAIERVFIPILEGLRELGFLSFGRA